MTTPTPQGSPLDAPTRADLLRLAGLLRRAAGMLDGHAIRCPVEHAPAHAAALRSALGVVRSVLVVAEELIARPPEP